MPTSDRVFYITASGQPSFNEAVAQGQPTIENPLGALEPSHIVITQVYMQKRSAYVAPDENSLCPPDISGGRLAFFCGDSARVPYNAADIVTWTRTWSTVPLIHNAYATTTVIYPAFLGDVTGSGSARPARSEFEKTTRAKIVYEYFIIGAGTSYKDESAIPLNSENEVIYYDISTPSGDRKDLLAGGVVLTNAASSPSYITTAPTAITYWGWVTTDSANATSYTLISEQSSLENYIGNIWRRITVRVKAL
jgi:hypothetical protein